MSPYVFRALCPARGSSLPQRRTFLARTEQLGRSRIWLNFAFAAVGFFLVGAAASARSAAFLRDTIAACAGNPERTVVIC